ncbi:MAG TPA: ribonuclease PH [Candidatus Eremiobacteraeota bacterium]|nr:MAG: Ribonuclease PH [bacterium ADurb.Bin363]HPZ09066.1 ribonuclease PH [Candidatus Eremiobacteraeota bacterium]
MERRDGRGNGDLRSIRIYRNYTKYAEGSTLIEMGETKIICTASVEDKIPSFIEEEGGGRGWITSEYSMLPRATQTRSRRSSSGRTNEIQRLIGRTLRAVTDLKVLGERTIILDCDVIQADGGTRTAAITGAFIALADSIKYIIKKTGTGEGALRSYVAAVSVGLLHGEELLDLTYEEDSTVDVDFNLAMTSSGEIVEIQTTAEGRPLTEEQLQNLLLMGKKGISLLIEKQKEILEPTLGEIKLFGK